MPSRQDSEFARLEQLLQDANERAEQERRLAEDEMRYRREGRQEETHRLLLRRTIDVSIHLPHNYRPLVRREMEVSDT